MKFYSYYVIGSVLLASLLIAPLTLYVSAESVPDWVKNVALFYGQGNISETEFLNAIKYLIENKIIMIDLGKTKEIKDTTSVATVIIPNGNAEIDNEGFYIPLNLEITRGATVVWKNYDVIGHTIQSQNEKGQVIPIFNSDVLYTGEEFSHIFESEGVYHYFCTLHPWRTGVVTVK